MSTVAPIDTGRRSFLTSVAVGAGLGTVAISDLFAEPEIPPEVRTIRFDHAPVTCMAPQYLAEELLRAEGFASIDYVSIGRQLAPDALSDRRIDFSLWDAASTVWCMDRNEEVVVLGGVHPGCWQLVAKTSIRSILDLKGKRIAIRTLGDLDHAWISGAIAYIGMDPRSAVEWVVSTSYAESVRLFAEGRVDACFATPPRSQDLRARQIGHVLVDSAQDRPWSQYYCCLLISSRRFVNENPIATKRVMRALLKATDICANEPERAAQFMLTRGFTSDREIALEVMTGLSFSRWRSFDPEDTLRFYALRFYEVGMIKTQPNLLIRQGSDWRFLNELKMELKS